MDNNKIYDSEVPVPDTSPKKVKTNGKKKKAIIFTFIGLIIIGAVSWFWLYKTPDKQENPMFDKEKQEEIIGMYGSTQTYLFYPIDHDLDIMTEQEYLDLDRRIYYKNGAETVSIDREKLDKESADIRFFVNYFDLAISGNYEEYNKLFTEEYYKSNEPYYSFTQQMIYDINLEKRGESIKNGRVEYYYDVSYRIHRNNGTFRNDIESDGARKLYFTLVEENGKILINSISYYTK